jgi:sulfite exporter TauE/SafE
MILQALSLGLSAGLFCMARCVPTLAPLLLLSPQKGLRAGLGLVGIFLGGRLVAYGLLGLLAGLAGSFGGGLPHSVIFLALTQVALGGMLIAQAFYSCSRKQCPGKRMLFGTGKTVFIAGVLNSVTLCPPILLAVSMAMENGSPWQGFFFFIIFFLATSIYVIPVSLAAVNLNNKILLLLTKIVCIGTGTYFIWRGLSIAFFERYIVY